MQTRATCSKAPAPTLTEQTWPQLRQHHSFNLARVPHGPLSMTAEPTINASKEPSCAASAQSVPRIPSKAKEYNLVAVARIHTWGQWLFSLEGLLVERRESLGDRLGGRANLQPSGCHYIPAFSAYNYLGLHYIPAFLLGCWIDVVRLAWRHLNHRTLNER